jgi:hypothetical protein
MTEDKSFEPDSLVAVCGASSGSRISWYSVLSLKHSVHILDGNPHVFSIEASDSGIHRRDNV